MTKEKLLNSIKDLPEQFSFDEIRDRIVLLEKIEKGLEQSKSGQVSTTEEAKEKFKKWLK